MFNIRAKYWVRGLLLLLLAMITHISIAQDLTISPLPVAQAFQLSVSVNSDKTLRLEWQIAPGYYLYRDRLHFTVLAANSTPVTPEKWPKGTARYDDILGHYTIYQQNLVLTLPLYKAPTQNTIQIQYQGCSSEHFCYPPQTKTFEFNFVTGEVHPIAIATSVNKPISPPPSSLIHWTILFSYFGLGILLAFTPCVLPLVPILSGIILGHNAHLKTTRAFGLSLAYVLGMCIVYTAAGLLFSLLGLSLQASLQTPWMIGFLCLLFIFLASCLLTGHDLRLPQKWTHKINALSDKQTGGHYISVAIIGALSALIVSPCVSAPLVGALTYISQTRNMWLGGSALFCLSFGMGLPLILFNTFGAHYIPKTGAWMLSIKKSFAFIFLGMAVWLSARLLPAYVSLFLWGALLLLISFYCDVLSVHKPNATLLSRLRQTAGVLFAVYGILLIVGGSLGHTNPLLPLQNKVTSQDNLSFKTVTTVAELNAAIQSSTDKPTLLDFYADWCVSCQELERTFHNPEVAVLLKQFNLVRVDMTHPSDDMTAIQQRWQVIAPPTIIVVNSQSELLMPPIVGAVNSMVLQQRLQTTVSTVEFST